MFSPPRPARTIHIEASYIDRPRDVVRKTRGARVARSHGILDNDTALDGLGFLSSSILDDIRDLGETRPSATSTARLAAAVGVLLQLDVSVFVPGGYGGPIVVDAIKAHAKNLRMLSAPARDILEKVAAGEGRALAERSDSLGLPIARLMNVGADTSPFAPREPSLFEGQVARDYVQSVANRCVEAVEQDFEDESIYDDLWREADGIGPLAALLVLAPCKVPVATIRRWQQCARNGLESLRANPDDELSFMDGYYTCLDAVFDALIVRFESGAVE